MGSKTIQRQEKIIQILLAQHEVTTLELAGMLNVSHWSIRRDLADLEGANKIERFHGGARLVVEQSKPALSVEKHREISNAKRQIGMVAASMVRSGEHVAIASGTTTSQVSEAIADISKKVFVITNALNIATQLSANSYIELTCTGGVAHEDYYALNGPITEATLRNMFFDKAIIGVSGLSIDAGLTVNSPLNAVTIALMMNHAQQVIVVCDHTKFGKASFAHLSGLEAVDILITDQRPLAALEDALLEYGVALYVTSEL